MILLNKLNFFSIDLNFYIIFFRVIPESPRWLLALKRYDEVIEIVKSAAKTNSIELPEDFETQFKQKVII